MTPASNTNIGSKAWKPTLYWLQKLFEMSSARLDVTQRKGESGQAHHCASSHPQQSYSEEPRLAAHPGSHLGVDNFAVTSPYKYLLNDPEFRGFLRNWSDLRRRRRLPARSYRGKISRTMQLLFQLPPEDSRHWSEHKTYPLNRWVSRLSYRSSNNTSYESHSLFPSTFATPIPIPIY